jgi:hypothetical protein
VASVLLPGISIERVLGGVSRYSALGWFLGNTQEYQMQLCFFDVIVFRYNYVLMYLYVETRWFKLSLGLQDLTQSLSKYSAYTYLIDISVR